MANQEIVKILREINKLLEIKGETFFRLRAYQKAILSLDGLEKDVSIIFEEEGIKGIKKIPGVGESIAQKIIEFLKKKKIGYYEDLKEETGIQQIITYYFETKGLSLEELKSNAKKRKIVYSRYTRPAKQLLVLAGSADKAKMAIKKVAEWALSRNLDYTIETIFKKWLELDRLKPKEVIKKPFYRGDPMVWSSTKKKWFVINPDGEWLEFADKEKEMEWRVIK
ncbi:hypothetical protein BWK69_01305 [Candidatus Parcubacteria bacterium A4]|nr:MAG: hypothetical protein BWK69_01305 [Candidatus Parcubacteria bacterium A4]